MLPLKSRVGARKGGESTQFNKVGLVVGPVSRYLLFSRMHLLKKRKLLSRNEGAKSSHGRRKWVDSWRRRWVDGCE